MDLQTRNYILYKIRTISKRKREFERLKKERDIIRKDIIDESPAPIDGQPRGKGKTSSPVEHKVLRLENIEKRMSNLDREFLAFEQAEKKIRLIGGKSWRIYMDTIRNESNLDLKAMEYEMSNKSLYNYRVKLIELVAKELGEFLDLNDWR